LEAFLGVEAFPAAVDEGGIDVNLAFGAH